MTIASSRKAFLRLLNSAAGCAPNSFRLFGVANGFAELGELQNTLIYASEQTSGRRYPTVANGTSPRVRISSDPRVLKGGAVFSLVGGFASRSGSIYTSRGDLVVSSDGVYEFERQRLLTQRPMLLPRVLQVDAPVAALSAVEFNYFHWMFDVVPKIHLLSRSGYRDIKLYVNISTDLQRDTLRVLGINPDRVVNSREHALIAADELVVPNFASRVGSCHVVSRTIQNGCEEIVVGNIGASVGVAAWICDFLRDRFFDRTTLETDLKSRILISRGDASKGRSIKNESLLSERLSRHGFQTVKLSGMRLVDQVNMFRSARVVIAPHGAGLTNLSFVRPGTVCIELFSPTYISDLYAVLCDVVGGRYHYLVGSVNGGWRESRSNEDFSVDLDELEELLRVAGVVALPR